MNKLLIGASLIGAYLLTGCASKEEVPEIIYYKLPSHFGEFPARHGYSLQFMPYEKNGIKVEPSKNWIPGHGYENIDLIEYKDKSNNPSTEQIETPKTGIPPVEETTELRNAGIKFQQEEGIKVAQLNDAPATAAGTTQECLFQEDQLKKTEKNTTFSEFSSNFPPKLSLTFPTNSSELTQSHKQQIESLIKTDEYIVVGYADEVGNACYNMNLSQRRALAVKAFMSSKGFNVKSAHGLGEIIEGDDIGNATNRRVDITTNEQVVISVMRNKALFKEDN